jgi:hypothetical protein
MAIGNSFCDYEGTRKAQSREEYRAGLRALLKMAAPKMASLKMPGKF